MANRRFIDFPIAASVGDNDIVLIWQDGLNKQTTKSTLFAGSPSTLASLTDVDISALTNGQILQYNSTTSKWENVDRTDIDLDQLGDVTIVSPTNGQVLVYNSSTSKWENSSGGFVPYTGAVTTVNLGAQSILAGSFVKAGGTSAQFLKANGSVDSTAYGTGSVTSVGLTMPSAFNVANSPVTTSGTIAVTGAGTVAQYIRGDGSLADFPESSGGGSSVSYYLNGSVSQGTIGGVAYLEMNKVPILGAGTDFTRNSNGYIASFITDAGDPNLLEIPGGNWNFESYFSASSGGGSPTFYVELYKVNAGGTATLIASNSANPELISFGTTIAPYFSSLAVPTTVLALTDRLAVRYYVTPSGRTLKLHTEGPHLCQIITTFTTGLTALNGLTSQVQFFAVGTTGTNFNIASSVDTHTFNLPTASATNRGALSSSDWSVFNSKIGGSGTSGQVAYFNGTSSITGESSLFWDATNDRLGIGTASPAFNLDVNGTGRFSGNLTTGADITLSAANPFVYGGTAAGSLGLSNIGGQSYIRVFGASHATTPNITQFVNAGSTSLTISNTGAATFSSSVTANGTLIAGLQGGNIQLKGATDGFVGVNGGGVLFLTDWATATKGLQINLSTGAATFSSSVSTPHTTKTANYTLDSTDYTVGFDCASNRTATLPDATTCRGRIYVIYQYNTGSGARSVTLDGNGSQTINGVTTYSLYPFCEYTSVMIQSNGANWIIISSNFTTDCL
jgi:hypothetical protein